MPQQREGDGSARHRENILLDLAADYNSERSLVMRCGPSSKGLVST